MQWDEFSFHIRHLNSKDQQLVRAAFDLGQTAHRGQRRQSGEPYFTHPIGVAQILIGIGADRDTIVAALLHDTIEDTPVTLPQIGKQFSPTVAALVDGVTKLHEEDLGESPTLDQQIETLRKMFLL